jgi:tyrosinase
MLNPISSPGDPIFYLHHTWLDKVWWDWQALNLTARLTDISGPNKQNSSVGFPEAPGTDWQNGTCSGFPCTTVPPVTDTQPGDPGNTTTLTHVLSTLGLLPNITIADVMDIQGGYLCYEYVDAE